MLIYYKKVGVKRKLLANHQLPLISTRSDNGLRIERHFIKSLHLKNCGQMIIILKGLKGYPHKYLMRKWATIGKIID